MAPRPDVEQARAELASGALRGDALARRLLALPPHERDDWVNELLGLPAAPPDDGPELPPGGVPYLPVGVDEILIMAREVPLGPEDELTDLGSGLGRVVMLAHALSGARATGVEVQGALVSCARAAAAALALDGVTFVHGDAAHIPLAGSVFFLYAPFGGETLTRVLARLAEVARRRSIVVCAAGMELPARDWLRRRATASPMLTLYDSCAPGALSGP